MKKQKQNDLVICVECNKEVELAECHLLNKVLREHICNKCFLKDNEVIEESEE